MATASATCRHALVLALDISGSVDPTEYRLQFSGGANALLAPDVQELKGYFDTEVIHGFGSFSMLALGYHDYKRAMSEKLLKELSFPIIGYNHHTLPKNSKKPL
ncbi:DUF1194 domain-containing protein [Amylibacter sp. SFDW26]|nr:DUF1194 domain-containing protein [Amylibacter sp. SFDW26]KAB7616035.1 DUF1194 domain-containing protein [Amylibacter sp. SFDW26]